MGTEDSPKEKTINTKTETHKKTHNGAGKERRGMEKVKSDKGGGGDAPGLNLAKKKKKKTKKKK